MWQSVRHARLIFFIATGLALGLGIVNRQSTFAQINVPPAQPPAVVAAPAAASFIFLPLTSKQPASAPAPSSFADQVITLVNQYRASAGCAALTTNAALTTAAQAHAVDMAVNDYFSHTGLNGSHPWDRATAAGYNWSMIGENIAAGYSTPAAAVAGWVASPPHYANMVNCNFQDTGVGYYYLASDPGSYTYHYYWVQDFGKPW